MRWVCRPLAREAGFCGISDWIGPMSGLAALADGGEWRDWGRRFVCRRYRSVPAPVRSRRSGWACPLKGVTGSAVWRWLGVGGHFEEVEDAADISVQSSQGLGDMKPTRLDELDGEASQAGGVFGAVSGADTAAVLIEGPVETMVGGIFDAPVASVQ